MTDRLCYLQRMMDRTRFCPRNRTISLIILTLIILSLSFRHRSRQTTQFPSDFKQSHIIPELNRLQFIPANHPFIRYVGRWTSTPDTARRNGAFPGIYFDIAMNGTSSVLLSLHHAQLSQRSGAPIGQPLRGFFSPQSLKASVVKPKSLLARVDDEEYSVLANVASLVSVRDGNLDSSLRHKIRIIAPMLCGETLQVDGVWIDESGQLLSIFEEQHVLPGAAGPSAKGPTVFDENGPVPEEHQRSELAFLVQTRRKMLEIVTDVPASMLGDDTRKNSQTTRGILAGVTGWEYLLGEMFGADHVTIGMDGMCLIQDCIGGNGGQEGVADLFFKSGPFGSEQYKQPWAFRAYNPDVIVMNIGDADWESFQIHREEYNNTTLELSANFVDTYVSLITAIRVLAYPTYVEEPMDSSPCNYPLRTTGPAVPIFIMRPFRGQLEQATHSVVDRLRSEGDNAVFWIDTSGWLNTDVDLEERAEDQDFFLDGNRKWRLTERANQRVAILLHLHVCRYLARDAEKCAFFPPEAYQDKAFESEALRSAGKITYECNEV